MIGIGIAAKSGILVKGGGQAFEEASTVDVLCFDKTGTLTEGAGLLCHDMLFVPNTALSLQDVLNLVKTAENASCHPIAQSIVRHCDSLQARAIECTHFQEIAGYGVEATVGDHDVLIGSEAFLLKVGLQLEDSSISTRVREWREKGFTVVLVGIRTAEDERNKTAQE